MESLPPKDRDRVKTDVGKGFKDPCEEFEKRGYEISPEVRDAITQLTRIKTELPKSGEQRVVIATMTKSRTSSDRHIPELLEALCAVLSWAFFAPGYRSGIIVDRKSGSLYRWFGFFRPLVKLRTKTYNDSRLSLRAVPIPVRIGLLLFSFKRRGKGIGKMYELTVRSPGREESVELFSFLSGNMIFQIIGEEKAKELARQIATFPDLPLDDKTG